MKIKFKKNKIIALVLCVTVLFTFLAFKPFVQNANAEIVFDPANLAEMIAEAPPVFATAGATIAGWAKTFAEKATEIVQGLALVAAKVLALLAVQQATRLLIGEGDGKIITDYNNYLYISPQQRALAQMDVFFNTVSKGRLSYFNYEGIGPNYDAYLVKQAKQSFVGTPFVTDLQEYVTNPATQLFSAGNMKGIMAMTTQCGNNVACYSLVSSAQYEKEFAKAQDIARSEQVNGFLPTKTKNGRITSPAALAQDALQQIDKLGTQLIMNADSKQGLPGALAQVAAGSAMSVASRVFNYYTASDKGKQEIRNKNDEFPFSLAYSLNGGIGISAGGITVNTGAAAFNLQTMIGNTCATIGGSLNGGGAIVTVDGRKYNCATKQEVSVTGPSVSFTWPSIKCIPGNLGDSACALKYNDSKAICNPNRDGTCIKY